MKKITILSLHLGYGGIEKAIIGLANNLCNNYEVEILSVYKLYDKPAFNINKNINIVYLTDIIPNNNVFRNYLKHFRLIKALKEGIKGIKYLNIKKKAVINAIKECHSDVIISTRDYFNTLVGKYKRVNVKTIAWEHNHYHGDMSYVKKLANSCINIDKLVVVSNELKDFYHNYFFNNSIKTEVVCIPNFLEYIPDSTSSLKNKKLISVGRLAKEKGFSDLIDVFKLVHDIDEDITLDIVGDGELHKELEEKINKYGLSKYISLKGFKNSKELDKLYTNASIYVLSSFTESFGIVIIEAMSHGIPVVAFSSAEGAKEIVTDKNGCLIDNRDKEKMAQVIVELFKDKKKLKKLSTNALTTSKKYKADEVIKDWFNLIEEKL